MQRCRRMEMHPTMQLPRINHTHAVHKVPYRKHQTDLMIVITVTVTPTRTYNTLDSPCLIPLAPLRARVSLLFCPRCQGVFHLFDDDIHFVSIQILVRYLRKNLIAAIRMKTQRVGTLCEHMFHS